MSQDPLAQVLPRPSDRAVWRRSHHSVAVDTGETVVHYTHQASGRTLRLDAQCRVYGQDSEGTVRLFGRGGRLALAVALNVIYDGITARPSRIVLPPRHAGSSSVTG